MCQIRNSAKAIIIKNGKLLCTKNKDQFGIFYLLPGGGQKAFETIVDALKRECREEISARIKVNDILFVRDYIGKNHEFAEWDSEDHQIEYMFDCEIIDNTEIKKGETPDNMQIGISWINLNELKEYRIYPKILKEYISEKGIIKDKTYLGDVN